MTTTDLPRVEPARISPSRAMVRGILLGALCGVVGGPVAVVLYVLFALVFGDAAAVFFAFYALVPAGFVGGVTGAATGLAGSGVAVVALLLVERPPATARSRRTAAAVGAALGSAAAIVVVVTVLAAVPPTVALVVAPIAAVVAARIASRGIDALAVNPRESTRERWSWRVLLAGFVVGETALVLAVVVAFDPYWWSWGEQPAGPGPIAALVSVIVVSAVAAVLLVAGAWLTVEKTSLSAAAALVLVAALFVVGALAVAGLAYRPERSGASYSQPWMPTGPAEPEPTPPAVEPVAPVPPPQASTRFTEADIVAAGQAQVDATIAAVGPIDDPAIPAGTTTFPVGIGGCGNLAGGRVNFEVWFLVDDLAGGFARARDAWTAAGFVPAETGVDGSVEVVGGPDSAIERMTLEDKEGTVKFTVQSVCVAGEDY